MNILHFIVDLIKTEEILCVLYIKAIELKYGNRCWTGV